MSDELQIIRLRDLYAATFDARDAAAFVQIFADDGALVLPGGKAITGHERLTRLVQSMPANGGRHIPIAAEIVIDGDTATCRGPYRMEMEGTAQTGTYDDAFIRTANGWRFSRREIIPDA